MRKFDLEFIEFEINETEKKFAYFFNPLGKEKRRFKDMIDFVDIHVVDNKGMITGIGYREVNIPREIESFFLTELDKRDYSNLFL